MNQIKLLIVTCMLGAATQADAAWAPSHYRCTFDQLDATRGEGRQKWAMKWAAANPYNRPVVQDSRFWANVYSTEAKEAQTLHNVWLYPVYVDPDDGYQPWKGPGGVGTGTNDFNAVQLQNIDGKVKPIQVLQDGICEPGCYTPNQQVLFEQGPVEIATAQKLGLSDLMTLAPQSSFAKITLIKNSVLYYTLDQKPAPQQILTFLMASGGHLSVTTQHPLVTQLGSMKKAQDFLVGESLVKQDGQADEILSIQEQTWIGRVYNLKPTTTDLTSNILIAQGYLNGSGRFQSEYVEELNRVLIRNNVPDALIPSS